MKDPLVIFDCDGVLVDSEPLSIRVLIDALRKHGLEMDEAEAYERFLGRSLSNMISVLDTDFGIDADHQFLEGDAGDLYDRFAVSLRRIRALAKRSRPCLGVAALLPPASRNASDCRSV